MVSLSEDNHRQLFIPKGFAHGFAVLRGDAIVQYKVDDYYSPQSEGTIRWNDAALNIAWGVDDAIVSSRDASAPTLAECEKLFD
jgi:dTDP-4-dehydrorhamnose 3,5-epimerase